MTAASAQEIAARVNANMRLVHWVIRRYRLARYVDRRDSALEYSDLVQAGLLGLARAARDYDADRAKFSTYAVGWIWQHITREIGNHSCAVRVPIWLQDKRRRARERVWPWLRSLDKPLHEDKVQTLADLLPGEGALPDAELLQAESAAELELLMAEANLSARERRVLMLRGADVQLEAIGDELAVSRERVRQIELKALGKLRDVAGSNATGGLGFVLRDYSSSRSARCHRKRRAQQRAAEGQAA